MWLIAFIDDDIFFFGRIVGVCPVGIASEHTFFVVGLIHLIQTQTEII